MLTIKRLEHHILEHEFKIEDFLGVNHLHHATTNPTPDDAILMHDGRYLEDPFHYYVSAWECLRLLVQYLNKVRKLYLETLDQSYLMQIWVLLPRSWKYIPRTWEWEMEEEK